MQARSTYKMQIPKKHVLYLPIFWFFFSLQGGFSQNLVFQLQDSIPLIRENHALENAWAGGVNTPQFSQMDLDQDGFLDLVIYDRSCRKLSTFLAYQKEGTWHYRHEPKYEGHFPKVEGWLLLRDYDADGRPDIFTHAVLGVKVFKNSTKPGGMPEWELKVDPLLVKGLSREINLQIGVADIAAIEDLDGDKDLDILTFDFAQGSYLEFYQNMSVEQDGKPGSLRFARQGFCWGDVFEGLNCGEFSFDQDCSIRPGQGGGGGSFPDRIEHIGSTISAAHLNGDRYIDILVGDVSCREIYRMLNVGDKKRDRFNAFDLNFPESKPIDNTLFPALFWVDIDQDGLQDLLVSPNLYDDATGQSDFAHSVAYYHNTGKERRPELNFERSDFLQHTMLDLGQGAYPFLWDVDQDGDLDLLLGHSGQNDGDGQAARLQLWQNQGNPQQAKFLLVDSDWGLLSQMESYRVYALGLDWNGDGNKELAISTSQGSQTQVFLLNSDYSQLQAGSKVELLPLNLPLSYHDYPFMEDLDGDGDTDILIGNRTGRMDYYENTGDNNAPVYELKQSNWGEQKSSPFHRHPIILKEDLNRDGIPELLIGDSGPNLNIYNYQGDLAEISELYPKEVWLRDPSGQDTIPLQAGLHPALGDLNGDGWIDILVGTQGGGVRYLENHSAQWMKTPSGFTQLQIKLRKETKEVLIFSPNLLQVEVFLPNSHKALALEVIPAEKEVVLRLSPHNSSQFRLLFSDPDGNTYEKYIQF